MDPKDLPSRNVFKAGDFLMVDKAVHGGQHPTEIVQVLRTFDQREARALYDDVLRVAARLITRPGVTARPNPKPQDFYQWLLTNGYLHGIGRAVCPRTGVELYYPGQCVNEGAARILCEGCRYSRPLQRLP